MERVVSNIKKMFENKDIESVENLFGIATEEQLECKFDLSEETILDYESIKLCLKEISHSFVDFLIKLSEGQYDDIEVFLE